MNEQKSHIAIIEGCRKNDRKCQEQLYKDYYNAMMTLCMRYTKNEADAVEVLNSGFLKVFVNIERYDSSKGNLYTWISTIIVNSCLNFIRTKTSREQFACLSEAEDTEVAEDVVNKLKAGDLVKLVRTLPPATQTVFNLYAIEGYTHKDIGKMLDISEGTSKWHLSEARKALQNTIKKNESSWLTI